ncbi:MAG: AI-2E family transporter, partial [Actinomycetota bacterium]|nr:AI-2E family transporter [Actinomycetota bacterium]
MPEADGGKPAEARVLRLDLRSGAWIAGSLLVGLLLVAFLRNVPDSVTKVGVGVLLAFALDPVVVRVQATWGCSRAAAVAIVGTTVAFLFAVLVLVLGPPALDQARRFGRELPQTVEQLYDLPLVGGWLRDAGAAFKVQQWAEDLPARIDTEAVTNTARSILDGVVSGLIVVLVGVAVLVDGERLIRRLRAAIPDRIEPQAVRVGRVFYRTIGAYFSGSLLVAALGATFILALGLAFDVPLAPAAALWMLVVNLIPQVGGLLGGGFFVLLAFSKGVSTGLACLAIYLIYQQIENHLIQPAVVGEAVDLSAPATMLAALVGAAAAGIPGALVATPLVGATKALYLELRWGKVREPRRAEPAWRRWRALFRRGRDGSPPALRE